MSERLRLATLASGSGTTSAEIIKSSLNGSVPIDIGCVVASNPDAGVIQKALALGISPQDIAIVNPNDFRGSDGIDQEGFGLALLMELQKHGIDAVTQNGWLPLTPPIVIDYFTETIFNQHPGPLPEFGGKGMYGRRVHAARLLFARMTKRDYWTEAVGQRAHYEYDKGAVVKAERIEIFPSDTVDSLQERLLPAEHRVQIELLQDLITDNLQEFSTHDPLIHRGDEDLLRFSQRVARLLYPHG
ncbi:phosphoribosylglycinamide formyltransferase [soil metagenome]